MCASIWHHFMHANLTSTAGALRQKTLLSCPILPEPSMSIRTTYNTHIIIIILYNGNSSIHRYSALIINTMCRGKVVYIYIYIHSLIGDCYDVKGARATFLRSWQGQVLFSRLFVSRQANLVHLTPSLEREEGGGRGKRKKRRRRRGINFEDRHPR